MLVFEERGKPEYPEKNLSEQRREPTTNRVAIVYAVTLCQSSRSANEHYIQACV